MPDETTAEKQAKPAKEAKAKTARVKVLKKIQYGNHHYAPGAEIPAMDFDEVKLRASAGEVRIIKVN